MAPRTIVRMELSLSNKMCHALYQLQCYYIGLIRADSAAYVGCLQIALDTVFINAFNNMQMYYYLNIVKVFNRLLTSACIIIRN